MQCFEDMPRKLLESGTGNTRTRIAGIDLKWVNYRFALNAPSQKRACGRNYFQTLTEIFINHAYYMRIQNDDTTTMLNENDLFYLYKTAGLYGISEKDFVKQISKRKVKLINTESGYWFAAANLDGKGFIRMHPDNNKFVEREFPPFKSWTDMLNPFKLWVQSLKDCERDRKKRTINISD